MSIFPEPRLLVGRVGEECQATCTNRWKFGLDGRRLRWNIVSCKKKGLAVGTCCVKDAHHIGMTPVRMPEVSGQLSTHGLKDAVRCVALIGNRLKEHVGILGQTLLLYFGVYFILKREIVDRYRSDLDISQHNIFPGFPRCEQRSTVVNTIPTGTARAREDPLHRRSGNRSEIS